MSAMTRWLRGPWGTPIVSGLLIVAAAILSLSVGVNPFGAGHQHGLGVELEGPAALVGSDLLMIAAALVAGIPIILKAIRALMVKVIAIDLLVAIAAVGALIIGQYWEAAAVTFLFAIGHALEAGTMNRTRSALAELVAVAPDVAVVMREGRQVEISAAQVRPDETVLVKNGAKVPVDGIVIGGTGIGADTTLARIIYRVEEAQDAKARTQTFMERFSTWYTPGIILLALITGLITGNVVLALTLLVIGCPGALVISIPVSIVAGIGRGARDGILIKGGEYLETSAKISAVALDKTGTLTEGRPYLTDVTVLDPRLSRADVLGWAARAEAGSEHPLARPIIDAAAAEGLSTEGLPQNTEPVPGKGIVATLEGRRVAVGNLPLLDSEGITADHGATEEVDRLAGLGRTPMVVALDGRVIGVVAVADRVRTDAKEMISRLHANGAKKVVMLTGDNRRVAEAVAAEVGVDEVRAQLLPEDKQIGRASCRERV